MTRARAIARAAGLVAVAIVLWGLSVTAGNAMTRAALFLLSAVAVIMACGRLHGLAIAAIGFLALAHDALQIPGFLMIVAGLIVLAVSPTLPGRRRRRDVSALPALANGPLVEIEPCMYFGGQRSRVIAWGAWLSGALGIFLVVLSGRGSIGPELGGLGLGCLIMALTFVFANWFATRVRVRIDGNGLHSRTFFTEHTIPWNDVAGLTLRYIMLGTGVRVLYYVVFSPTREFNFASSMKGARELQAAIERATGLQWPPPEMQPNF